MIYILWNALIVTGGSLPPSPRPQSLWSAALSHFLKAPPRSALAPLPWASIYKNPFHPQGFPVAHPLPIRLSWDRLHQPSMSFRALSHRLHLRPSRGGRPLLPPTHLSRKSSFSLSFCISSFLKAIPLLLFSYPPWWCLPASLPLPLTHRGFLYLIHRPLLLTHVCCLPQRLRNRQKGAK